MRLTVTVVSPATGQQADVMIDADPGTAVAQLAAELDTLMHGGACPGAGPAAGPAAPALFVGWHQVPGDLKLADSPVMDGCVVSIADPAGCRRPEPAGVAEIRVASGPAAGTLYRLPFGTADVGGPASGHTRAAEADIVIGDPVIPPLALRVQLEAQGALVAPFDGVPVLLDRRPLTSAAFWRPGQQISVGGTLLDLAPYEPPDAALHPAEDGGSLEFNRPPRLLPPGQAARFALPGPPAKPERRPVPVLMAVVPVVLGVAMAYFLRQVYMLAMAAFSPVMLLGSYVSDRRHGRKSHARQQAGYREHKARVERDARQAVDAERLRRRHDCPDPATVLSIVSGPRRRLWERRRTDPDYLLLRVGTADLPSTVELTDPTADEHRRRRLWLIPDAPLTISLAERHVVGVVGPADVPRAAGRWLVGQLAALHSPQDVQLYILTDSTGQAAWAWARWLPHCRPAEGQNCAALIGTDAETVAARIAELQAIITARRQALADRQADRVRFSRDIVVVFDGSRKLRSLPGAIGVLREGGQVGVYCICLDADERLLPAECHAVIAAGPDGALVVQQMNAPAIGPARPEYVTPAWSDRLARSIAPVRDVSGDDEAAGLPGACRLLDVLDLEPPAAGAIAARWNAGGRSTVAVIGACYDGPFGIDLRKDGPHALIAGTTGAGKSELLQTLIASLACANRPDAMTFVLVDYKGGSAFSGCADLPHVVGMVTDLDAHLTQRALASLAAELTRRERILAAAGVKDIEDYTARLDRETRGGRADGLLAPMPRLVIVIDEFASLVRDLPDFVTGLVGIAQRGRSLGLHLILATQRPSGVVSADIRANTNLRIALRVTDAAESTDVIEAPDAASISRAAPGRGYVRLGHASLVPFQAGRIGGHRPGADPGSGAARPWVRPVSWRGLGHPEPPRPAGGPRAGGEVTDLTVLVGQVSRAAAGLGIGAQPSPWLPPLPRTLLLHDLPATPGRPPDSEHAEVPFGLTDLPDQQRQRPDVVHLPTFGHLMAAGAPRSGRSQLLRTIAASIAVSCSCADVHLYGIDCGNGALLPLAGLPHCGAVVTRTQAERATRLITRLGAELQRRQDLLAEGGFADVTEQRAAASPPGRLPHIIVLLDRWEGFTTTLGETGGGVLTDVITAILAEGASAGVHLVMTGDRSLLAGRIAAMCEDKLAFSLAEKDDYVLIGLRPRTLPDDIPPGRAFRAGTGTQTQVALLDPDPSGQGQAAALRQIAAASADRDTAVPRSLRPFRVDLLPARITFDQAWNLRPPGAAASPLWGLAGVGGDELTALGPDLADGTPAFIVAGPARSGRSAVLASMTRSFLAGPAQVILVTPRPSPLRSLACLPGVIASFTGPDLGEDDLAAAIAALTAPGVVVIDDADLLAGCDAGRELSKIITGSAGRPLALVLAGDPDILASGFGGWQADARRARRGCLTAPQGLPDGDLIGARLTHAHTGHPVKPGRALLHTGDGTLTTIAVPIGGGPPPLGGTPARSVPTIPAMAASQAQHRDPSNPADAYRPDQE
jgi:S-DNA-T family DNA segregation ATPase FtsK/SpoIIIE